MRIASRLMVTLALALWGAAAPLLTHAAEAAQARANDAKPARLALVIGNSDYPTAPLRNPVNDAGAVARKLKELGFTVTLLTNAGLRPMQRAMIDFGERLKEAGGVGLFYYAGHGLQVKGKNYLVPTDARLEEEGGVRIETADVDLITEQMLDANNGLNLIVLDACRNNPFERRFRGGSRGLAAIDAAQGTLIAYATSPGAVAGDGEGDHGVYTEALLQALSEPGLKVEEMFKRVRIAVAERTHNAQMPWESSSLMGDFIFNPKQPDAPQPAFDPAALEARQAELAFWNAVASSSNPADFEDYLAHYPSGEYAGLAQRRLQALKAAAPATPVAASAQPASPAPPQTAAIAPPPVPAVTPAATEPQMLPAEGAFRVITSTYFRALPNENAKVVASLKAGDDLRVIAKTSAGDWYQARAARGEEGYVAAAALVETAALEEAEWQRISTRPSVATIGAFLKQFPNGRRTAEATAQLELLRKAPLAANKLTPDQAAASSHTSTGVTTSPRCNSILERSQLGEPIADADRVFLSANCH
jgi:uncharacterized caspase-like protein/uncharacterized protein YgiM (DUF1202 family)